MTYKFCRTLIERAEKSGTATEAYAADMKIKLDVFLLNNRLTETEYDELNRMLDAGAE